MARFLFSGVLCLTFLAKPSVLLAQLDDEKLTAAIELVNNSSDRTLIHSAVSRLQERQKEGKDISAAFPGLRRFVVQNLDREKPRGVHGDANPALLCLMRLGDANAIEHYLAAQGMHFQRTRKPIDFRGQYENEYLAAIDKDHHEQALALLEKFLAEYRTKFYQKRHQRDYPLLLAWLAHFSQDESSVVAEVNAAWNEHLARRDQRSSRGKDFSWFVPVVCRLANQPGLMPNLLSEIQSGPALERELYGVLLATVAPFRRDALMRFQSWLKEEKNASSIECWIVAYIDSAHRLPDDERKQAYARLIEIAKAKYDQVKPIHPLFNSLTRMDGQPTFTPSEKALVEETSRAFGDGDFSRPKTR